MKFLPFGLVVLCCITLVSQAAEFEITELTPVNYEVVELITIFEENAPYYVDREYVITVIPDEVLNEVADKEAYWIKTANDNKHNADENHITFETNANVWVYIAFDRRSATPPPWVTENYEDLGVNLSTSDVSLGVWKSIEEVPAGLVQLHGNDFGGATGSDSNYGAFVVMGSPYAVEASGKLTTTWGQLRK